MHLASPDTYIKYATQMSICGRNHVCSVSSTILVGSILYLHILSSNFSKCVTCKYFSELWSFDKFFEFVTVTLFCLGLGSNMNWSVVWVIRGGGGILRMQVFFVIQIKICAEYRDMLPRPRLVCQEPGLRPIGRSPGVPDKSSRGLGSMSRYSAQILICFIAYIFPFFVVSSVGLVGNCAGLPSCTVPSAIVHCNQNEAGHQTIKAPSMPCWGAAGL